LHAVLWQFSKTLMRIWGNPPGPPALQLWCFLVDFRRAALQVFPKENSSLKTSPKSKQSSAHHAKRLVNPKVRAKFFGY
jgi:hypothetical protein